MDEEHRDVYNRFGTVDFDPRKDELKLIVDIVVKYLVWLVVCWVSSFRRGSKAARTWLAIVGLLALAAELAVSLTEIELPVVDVFPINQLCEFELVLYFHVVFPLIVSLLCCLAETLYIDADQVCLETLQQIALNQKVCCLHFFLRAMKKFSLD
jgi:uncharacterized membrane protein